MDNKTSVSLVLLLVLIILGMIAFAILFGLSLLNYNKCSSTKNSINCNSISCYFDSSTCCSSYQNNCYIDNWLTGTDTNGNKYYENFGNSGIPPSLEGSVFNICIKDEDIGLKNELCSKNPTYGFCSTPSCSIYDPNSVKSFCGFGNQQQVPSAKNVSMNLCFYANNPNIIKKNDIDKIEQECVNNKVKGLYSFAWKYKDNNTIYTYDNLF